MSFDEKVRTGGYESKLPYGPTPETKAAFRADSNRLNLQFFEDAQEYAIASNVPEEYAAKVVGRAWSEGHASGYSDVLNHLESLIEIFN